MLGPSLSVVKPSFPRVEKEQEDLPGSGVFLGLQAESSQDDRPGADAIPSSLSTRDRDEVASCPICCGELNGSISEVGALLYQGQRIEPDLYHAGCITMMLCHKLPPKSKSMKGKAPKIKWDLSPVTRRPVDGFQLMPTFDDEQSWVKFLDWRGDGWLTTDSLVLVVSILLNLDDAAAERFLLKEFKVRRDREVSFGQFTTKILPSMKKHYEDRQRPAEPLAPKVSSHQAATSIETSKSYDVNSKHVEVLCCQLEECDDPVQLADAASKLGEIAPAGEVRVIDVAGTLLESSEVRVQHAGAALLMRVAGKGNDHAIQAVSAHLQHSSMHVRLASLEVLPRLTEKGNTSLIQNVWTSRVNADHSVCLAVVAALVLLAERGDQYVVDRLQDDIKSFDGRKAKSDDNTVNQAKIDDDSLCERELLALGEVASKNDQASIDLLLDKLGHSDFKVRRTATAALGKVAGKGNQRALDAVFSMMREVNPDVRWGGVCALVHLVEPGDVAAIRALVTEAKSQEIWLKGAAVNALGQVALPDGGIGEQAVRAALKDPNVTVQQKATFAMQQISERGLRAGGDTREKSKGFFRWFGQR